MKPLLFFLLATGLLLSSCNSSPQNGSLKEAQQLYLENLTMEEEVSKMLTQLEQISNSIQIQGRALNEEELAVVEGVGKVQEQFGEWKQNLREVPGVEAPGHEGHNHGKADDQLTSEQHLAMQKSLSQSLSSIKESAKQLLADQ